MEGPDQNSDAKETSGILFCSSGDPKWPDEGERTFSINTALAQRCDVGQQLLELAANDAEEDSYGPSTSTQPPPSDTLSALMLPCVPGSVPSHGLTVLNNWAARDAQAASSNRPEAAWLPAFLAEVIRNGAGDGLLAAACAADFLGCRPFQLLFLEVQLLRVALLLKDTALQGALGGPAGGAGHRCEVPPLSGLKESDLRKLPRFQVQQQLQQDQQPAQARPSCGQSQPSGDRGQELDRAQDQDQAPQPAGAGPSAPAAAAAAAGGASVQAEWDDWYGEALERQLPPQGPPPPPQDGLPLRPLGLAEMDKLVVGLVESPLLRYTGARPWDVGSCLFQLGFRPTLAAKTGLDERKVSNGKVPYLVLQLEPPRSREQQQQHDQQQQQPVGGAGLGYEVESVRVEVVSHDQGWSSFPEDHRTYNNSWTWFELVVVAGADNRRLRPDDPGRLFTNLHAVRQWQEHRSILGDDSQLVRDLNAWLRAAGGGAGAAQEGREAVEQPSCKLLLLACAAFPGWTNYLQRAEMTVTFRPVEG